MLTAQRDRGVTLKGGHGFWTSPIPVDRTLCDDSDIVGEARTTAAEDGLDFEVRQTHTAVGEA